MSAKAKCKLCACEGVQGTVLCHDHLEGFEYACKLLFATKHEAVATLLKQAISKQVAALPDPQQDVL